MTGMLQATFTEEHKLLSAEIVFDINSLIDSLLCPPGFVEKL